MVISLTGTVDNVPVIFAQAEQGVWTASVPADLQDGEYLVELTATDDAGNQTYYVGRFFIWQKVVTRFEILPQPYTHTLRACSFTANIHTETHSAVLLRGSYIHTDRGDKFCIKIL